MKRNILCAILILLSSNNFCQIKTPMEKDIFLDFIQAINMADTNKLYDLMATDHIFIDSQDNKFTGNDKMKQAWAEYFMMFPDYKIIINEILEQGSMVCAFGYAEGTYKNIKTEDESNYWNVPAAWKAIIINGKVKQWQVYADNTKVMEIVKRNQ